MGKLIRGWETQSFYQSKLLVASGIPGWNATNLLYRHQGEMLRFLCRLINLITPNKWELVESKDVKKLRPTFIVHQFQHRHHRERCPDTFYVVFAFHPVFCESHFVVHVRLGSALQAAMAPPCSSMVFTDSLPRAPQGAEQIYASTFLHSDMWVGRRLVKTNVGHFDDQTLQLQG